MSTSDRFPLAAKACFSEEELNAMASPFLSGTRLAFEWNKVALEPLVRSFMKVEPEDPSPDPENQTQPPEDHDQQPVWDMGDNQSQRPDAPPNDGIGQGDFLAFYKAACRSEPGDYGIHFRVGKIRGQALRLEKRLNELTKASRPVEESEVLEALIIKIFWHETGHAWIEDIAASIEPSLERYRSAQTRWGAYIFMEEAICNTIALRMLRFYLRESANSPMIKAFTEFMKAQGKGYNRFTDLGPWSNNQNVLEKNIVRLLVEVYGYKDRKKAETATKNFFTHDNEKVRWVTGERHPKEPIAPFLLNWKHPLHAEQLENGGGSGPQMTSELIDAALDVANDLKTKDPKEWQRVKDNIDTILANRPDAIHDCDFIGPDAAVRVLGKRIIFDLSLITFKKLQSGKRPKHCDCYGIPSKLQYMIDQRKVMIALSEGEDFIEL